MKLWQFIMICVLLAIVGGITARVAYILRTGRDLRGRDEASGYEPVPAPSNTGVVAPALS